MALFLAPLVAGCALACEEVGCTSTLEVVFHTGALDDGEYRAEADFGGTLAEGISFDLDGGHAYAPSDAMQTVSYDGNDVVVTFALGTAEPADQVAVALLDVWGDAVVQGVVEPVWSEPWYPNGKACDDAGCVSASVSVE